MTSEQPTTDNRAARRRRMRRKGGMVGMTVLATTGLVGAYLGNPRLPRSYAAAVSCGTAGDTTSLNAAINAFNTGSVAGCNTITLSASFGVDPSGVTPIARTAPLTIDGDGHVVTGYVGGGGIQVDLGGELLTVQDITFTTFTGAPILQTINGTDLTITKSTFTKGAGGALATAGGDITITDSVFDGNGAVDDYGSVILFSAPTATVSHSTFTNNDGKGIAALTVFRGTPKVTATATESPTLISDSYFAGNTSIYTGGALMHYSEGVPLAITGSTFTDNSAQSGGAVFSLSDLSAVNSTFEGNTSKGQAGAIGALGDVTLSFSTLANNVAGDAGNAVYSYGVQVTNSIIAGSAPGSDIVTADVKASHSSLRQGTYFDGTTTKTFATNGVNGNQVGRNPLLGTLGDNGGFLVAGSTTKHIPTMAPAANSPVLNAATFTAGTDPATDQRGTGYARSSGGKADMGAVEQQAATIAYTGARTVATGSTLRLSATTTPATCAGTPTYTLSRNPVTGATGSYRITGPNAPTSTWLPGTYTLTVALPATTACRAASTTATITVTKAPVPLAVTAAPATTRPARGVPTRVVTKVTTPGRDTTTVHCAPTNPTTAGDRRWCTWTQNPTTGAITVTTLHGVKVRITVTITSNPTGNYPSTRYTTSTWTRTWTTR